MSTSNPWRAKQQVRRTGTSGLRIAVVVPCYNVQAHVVAVVQTMPDYVHDIILVNDASQDQTGTLIDQLSNERIHAIHLPHNRGVGGAVLAGFAKASELGADIIVKMDGDGQMDPNYLPLLIEPLMMGKADYTKGNRFRSVLSLAQMPMMRRLGNAGLSFLIRLASGYWNVFDPSNGYVATRREVLEMLPLEIIHRRYFFESSMLIALGILGAVVLDIPMHARYGIEKSNLRIGLVLFKFPLHLTIGFVRRILLRKILYSLTMEAILSIFGVILIMAGTVFGVVEFVNYAIIQRTPAPAGAVMTAALPVFLGFQMLMNAILLDIQSVPSVPLCDRYVPGVINGVERELSAPGEGD